MSFDSDNQTATIWILHNEVRNLVLIQTHMLDDTYTASISDDNDGTTLGYVSVLDNQINTDMVELLEGSNNKGKTLQQYITNADNILLETQWHVIDLEQERQEIAFQRTECQKDKAIADNTFFRWLESNNTSELERWLASSKEFGACDVQLRIEYNALGAIIAKINKKGDLLAQKRDLLSANQDAIVQNFIYFKDTELTLETLAKLRDQLDKIQRANAILQ